MNLPTDPHILFSVVNTLLRDKYSSLEELCEEEEIEVSELESRLSDCVYDPTLNKFI